MVVLLEHPLLLDVEDVLLLVEAHYETLPVYDSRSLLNKQFNFVEVVCRAYDEGAHSVCSLSATLHILIHCLELYGS